MVNTPGRMRVHDFVEAGRLIVKLAKGEQPIPEGMEDAVAMFRDYGIEIEGYSEVRIHRREDVLHLVLPPAEAIAQNEARFSSADDDAAVVPQAGADANPPADADEEEYPLPTEYTDYVDDDPNRLSLLDMFYFRVGEYALGQCM